MMVGFIRKLLASLLVISTGIEWSLAAPTAHGSHLFKRSDSLASSSMVSTYKTWATFSSIAYCYVGGWNCGPYCDRYPNTQVIGTFDPFFGTDQVGYVAYAPDVNSIVISFRGTFSVQNFVDDAEFTFSDYSPVSGAKVHSGFLNNLNSVQDQVIQYLATATAAHPNVPIIITGHSMGGAVAVLSALDLLQKGIITTKNAQLFTYGEPRVGNPTFANYVDSTGLSATRVTHWNDIVPHLPPASFGYEHHNGEKWIHFDDSTTTICQGHEDPSCADSTVPFNDLLPDHLIYYELINFCIYI